ncbi:MAG: hypothetical protein HND55_08265 [Pseudomonadota bacterium]|nr:MAG: hypothetical protein HND55_08265 [Pseudomonadota bacterium]
MAAETRLLIDVGSTSVRALAVDADDRILARASRPLKTQEAGRRVEYRAGDLLAAVEGAACEAAEGRLIDQAGLAVQRGSIACWDRRTGEPLAPVISWRDRRTADEAPPLPTTDIRMRTGLRFSPYAGAPKIAWCRAHLPAVVQAERRGRLAAGPLGSFLAARLGASVQPGCDHTLAQRTLLWSRARRGWDQDLLDAFDIPESILPEVVGSTADFGSVGILPGAPPLRALVGDQNVLPFIDGQPDPHTLYVNLGTGAFLIRPVAEPIDTDRFQLSYLGGDAGFALEGSVHGAGSALAWLARHDQGGSRFTPGRLAALDPAAEPSALFLNTIDGLGSPWWCGGPEAAFAGVANPESLSFDRRLAAVVESIAFLIRANLEAMNRLTAPPRRIIVSGGLGQSDFLVARLGGLIDVELLRLRSAEGTAMGLGALLSDRPLPDAAFEPVPCGTVPAIERRYGSWLEALRLHMQDPDDEPGRVRNPR